MKKLLFLLLFPCLCVAQYTGNAGQKITLGEQTTADGLVYRGVLADTGNITPFSDTSAYIILDTVNNRFYNYNRTTNVWNLAGGGVSVSSFSAGTTGLTPSTATTGAVTLGGTLAVANGGTGSGTKNFVDLTTTQTITGLKTFDVGASSSLKVLGTAYPSFLIESSSSTQGTSVDFKTTSNSSSVWAIGKRDDGINSTPVGSLWVYNGSAGTTAMWISPSNAFQFNGAATFSSLAGINDVGADANGKLQAATSDMNLKNTIEDSPFGLNEILILKPVTFLYNDENRKIDSDVKEVGFIAQDVFDIIPNSVSSTGTGDLQLDYRAITATLVKAIQEQQALIKALEQRLLILENK